MDATGFELDKKQQLIKAMEDLDREKIIWISQSFLLDNRSHVEKEHFKGAMEEGVAFVVDKYVSGQYSIDEITILCDSLSEVLSYFEENPES